jgi:hypothetical protein
MARESRSGEARIYRKRQGRIWDNKKQMKRQTKKRNEDRKLLKKEKGEKGLDRE